MPNRELIFTTVPKALLYLQSLSQENSLVQVVCRLFFFLSPFFIFFFLFPPLSLPLQISSLAQLTNLLIPSQVHTCKTPMKESKCGRRNCKDQHQHYHFPSGFVSVLSKILCMHVFSRNVARCSFDTSTSLQTWLISLAPTLFKRWHWIKGLVQKQIFKIPGVCY